ncbi:HD domain-containing protein [Pseudoalteromonas luteoviolacea]|uniref:HD-GYP domain-containing protein n=1 Tax=Pseudoalteromonas luteoviolacea TaxID=43657 RepID=UPI001B374857|nr:HD-GYP domain-containing protein [Pseudoalteromonas luteoviolacea]MBQ4814162.1 HD domain-containing protein [Pseudoalteromonas luteoviolacea]
MHATIPINELVPGMFVDSVHKLKSDADVKLKSRGMVRNSAIIAKLEADGVLELNIDIKQSQVPVPAHYLPNSEAHLPTTKNQATTEHSKGDDSEMPLLQSHSSIPTAEVFAAALSQFEVQNKKLQILYGNLLGGEALQLHLVNDISQEIIASVTQNSNVMAILTRLKDKRGFNWRHMINCTILMTIFTKYLGLKPHVVSQMAMAAMLHDIGKSKVPQSILEKATPLTENEKRHWQKHVAHSVAMVKDEKGITPLIVDMIVNHHERIDGSGFPRGLKAEKLSKAARVMAIVDEYATLITGQAKVAALEPVHALRVLLSNKDKFDEVLVHQFIKCIGVHPVGTIVKLTNDRLGLVMAGNKENPKAPMVRVFYNAKHMHHVTLKDVDLNDSDDIKIIANVKPLDYQINLSRLLQENLLV